MILIPWLKGQSRFEKAAERYRPVVTAINALTKETAGLNDAALKERVIKFKGRPLEEIKRHTPEIFAAVREAGRRTLQMRHFDVQLLGGLALLDNKISEMKTGEGKTLVATLPLILHALAGQGAHLVTVNDYLANRDAAWMGPLYDFFDLSVGMALHGQTAEEKRAAYAAAITYGTNNEFGFDYLRDNMAQREEDIVQRDLNFAIVDEVDSILIDESRTPLIISAPDTESTQLYDQFSRLVPQLEEGAHYNIDEKRRAATLTDEGTAKIEDLLGVENIYEEKGIRFVHHLEQALRAQTLYHRDKDYVIKDGQIIIVDEFTGRLMEGRRYAEGLHQAIEAKEKVKVQQESRTLATITFQNFFRLYNSLAGMTGTAVTSAEEFEKVYNLDVVAVPTNKPMIRNDKPDKIFVSEQAKGTAIIDEIKHRHRLGQSVLVGTIAIEKSERLSAWLKREGIPHEVLNAKHHAREAEIISRAGQKGAVTISTNMAGRGTDIKLGDGVVETGGLLVLGTERHEARRIDNQLRGRAGRQGDPGETQFFVSLEDDIMRIFGGDKIRGFMQKLKLPEDQPIENKIVSRTLEGAQERVEGHYFDMRKQVLSYDNVLNRQREAIYTLRRGVLLHGQWRESEKKTEKLSAHIETLAAEQADQLVAVHTNGDAAENWNIEEIAEATAAAARASVSVLHGRLREAVRKKMPDGPQAVREQLIAVVRETALERLKERERELGEEGLRDLEKAAAMRAIDIHWMEHLDTMDYLRAGIGLRSYGQRDPLVEYQKEGYLLFQRMLSTIKSSIVEVVFKAQAIKQDAVAGREQHQPAAVPHSATDAIGGETPVETATDGQLRNPNKGVGRNDPCPCGSGKKFKKCHGAA